MRKFLLILFAGIFITMLFFTVRASWYCNVFEVPEVVLHDPWFQATLVDAYLGFITFYAWVAYRESTWLARGLWFLAIMALGNMAMAAYVLWNLFHLPQDSSLEAIFVRPVLNSQK